MTAALTAIRRGYAYVEMQERGQFFSEGNGTSSARPSLTAKMRSLG